MAVDFKYLNACHIEEKIDLFSIVQKARTMFVVLKLQRIGAGYMSGEIDCTSLSASRTGNHMKR